MHSSKLLSGRDGAYLIPEAHAAAALPKAAGHALEQVKGPPVVQIAQPSYRLDLQGKIACGRRWLPMTARLAQPGSGLC